MIKVLIVEDDPMVAKFIQRFLEKVGGFSLEAIASNGDEALDILEKRKIDLILLDIYMPGMNGLELLAQIRRIGKGVDVIVISAASDTPSIQKALRYGAIDYLIKPFEYERFHAALWAYQEESRFMKDQKVLTQEALDKHILYKDSSPKVQELPKGLTKKTLKMIWESIQEWNANDFTTEELANRIGISRVSLRKYLHFLSEIEVLEEEIIYGSVGRPVYKHRYIHNNRDLIKPYL